jgi:hypothetical protein
VPVTFNKVVIQDGGRRVVIETPTVTAGVLPGQVGQIVAYDVGEDEPKPVLVPGNFVISKVTTAGAVAELNPQVASIVSRLNALDADAEKGRKRLAFVVPRQPGTASKCEYGAPRPLTAEDALNAYTGRPPTGYIVVDANLRTPLSEGANAGELTNVGTKDRVFPGARAYLLFPGKTLYPVLVTSARAKAVTLNLEKVDLPAKSPLAVMPTRLAVAVGQCR